MHSDLVEVACWRALVVSSWYINGMCIRKSLLLFQQQMSNFWIGGGRGGPRPCLYCMLLHAGSWQFLPRRVNIEWTVVGTYPRQDRNRLHDSHSQMFLCFPQISDHQHNPPPPTPWFPHLSPCPPPPPPFSLTFPHFSPSSPIFPIFLLFSRNLTGAQCATWAGRFWALCH